MAEKYILEKSPGLRRTVQWRIDGSHLNPKLYRVETAPAYFVTEVYRNNFNDLRNVTYALGYDENEGSYYPYLAPNVDFLGIICMGDMRKIIQERIKKGEPPNLPDLFWNSLFTSVGPTPDKFSWRGCAAYGQEHAYPHTLNFKQAFQALDAGAKFVEVSPQKGNLLGQILDRPDV